MSLEFKEVATEVVDIPILENVSMPEETQKKKGRGRPKKSESLKEEKPKEQKPKENLFDKLKRDIEENKTNINPEQETNKTEVVQPVQPEQKSIINGYMLLLISDLFFPSLIKIIFKKASKDIKIKELQLSSYQKESLEPLADAVASQVLSYVDPLTLFFVVLGGTYYMNFEELKDAKSNSHSRT